MTVGTLPNAHMARAVSEDATSDWPKGLRILATMCIGSTTRDRVLYARREDDIRFVARACGSIVVPLPAPSFKSSLSKCFGPGSMLLDQTTPSPKHFDQG
jgi:hypothetical protein